jgi:hypothetical protein
VRAAPDSDLLGPAEPAPYTAHAVRHHRFSIAGTAEHDAAIEVAGGDSQRDWTDEVRIVAWFV